MTIPWDGDAAKKAGYPHFMLKEIHEQAQVARELLAEALGRLKADGATIVSIPFGESDVELLEPRSPEHTVARFLETRGEGIHHVSLAVDDVAATLLGNVLRWQVEQLSRMTPVRPASHPRLVKTVKPLIRVTEREAVAYCLLRGVDYHEDECPNAAGATLLLYKDVINQIEAVSAGSKQAFYQEFVKKLQPRLAAAETVTLRECDVCGQATTGEVCAYCRMMERARQVTVQRGRVTRTVLEVPAA